jgi:hypothetical protein
MEPVSIERLKEACLRSEAAGFGDPLLAHTAFHFQKTYFPLGFPVSIATNSQMVLEAADQSWGAFELLFERAPIRLEIGITAADSPFCPPAPVGKMRHHLVTNVADGENFATCDLSKGCSVIWATDAALQHTDYFRYFFLESAAMVQIAARHATGIHAACVALDGNGVLLCGDTGAGKSTLAYACSRAGWTYTTDDGSYLVNGRSDRLVVGNCVQVRFRPTAEALFPELHGLSTIQRAGVGKPSLELPTHSRSAISTSMAANIKHVVFLKRHVSTQEVVEFPRAVARLYMEQRVHCLPYGVSEQMASIDRLLETEIQELRYNELDWAIKELSRLVREGR